ncbi:MAG TPA: hypothetical protein VJO72_06700 [Candidatus Dormibacteraeota bacterium]|nr:hypothetical protein [Candidatus Dormibacteraeota bacterium]
MSIASTHRPPAGRAHRVERRSRRRVARSTVQGLAGLMAWSLLFLALGWLVAAGFYGLLASG